MKASGLGLATIATEHNPVSGAAPMLTETRRQDEEAAASAAASV